MNDQHGFDLAMKVIAHQATDAERAELDALLAKQPELKAEFEQLQAEARVARETLPLVAAIKATTGEFPAYARERLQTKVRQTFGRPETKGATEAKPNWLWLRWLVFATVAAVIAVVAIPAFLKSGRPIIQLAMLDTTGPARGGTDDESRLLRQNWKDTELRSFSKTSEADTWRQGWSASSRAPQIKILYDRAAAEVQVSWRLKGKSFEKVFPIEKDFATTLQQVNAFIREQIKD